MISSRTGISSIRINCLRLLQNVLIRRHFCDQIVTESFKRQFIENFRKYQLKSVPKPSKSNRVAAILVPICKIEQQLSLLYTTRSRSLKSQGGQICFPGGYYNSQSDSNFEQTSLRETHEELGLSSNKIEIWGSGHILPTTFETPVKPIFGYIRNFEPTELQLNSEEVFNVFTVSLKRLSDPRHFRYTQFANYSLPVFVIDANIKIWGFTAIVTHLFLKAFLQQHYRNDVVFASKVC